MLLSDRDIAAELDAGRIGLDPLDREMIQPSSIDVRLDRFFRLFDNHKYAVIDPATDQPDLTRLVEVEGDPSSGWRLVGLSDGPLGGTALDDLVAEDPTGESVDEEERRAAADD